MKASECQEGGNHYKDFPIQPAEFCQRNRLNWCEANVVKYVCRHASKKGAEDLRKAKHYIDLLLEWEYPEINIPVDVPLASPCDTCATHPCDDLGGKAVRCSNWTPKGEPKAEKESLCASCGEEDCAGKSQWAMSKITDCSLFVAKEEPKPERKASLCHSCATDQPCSKQAITQCEDYGHCPMYIPSLRERMMDAKEEAAKGVHISEWYAQESAKQSKPAPVALDICHSCNEHPGCKGQYPPVTADGSCNGFSAKEAAPLTLWDIFEKVKAENARSKEKYGLWKGRTEEDQWKAIRGEFNEWNTAHCNGDIHGPHGEIIEAIQTINVLCRRIQFLTGEAAA